MTRRTIAAPPQLMFDDGSRIIHEDPTEKLSDIDSKEQQSELKRGNVDFHTFYEIERIARQIKDMAATGVLKCKRGYFVALQFPDYLLEESHRVCWELEERLCNDEAFVFLLGDSTFAPCCPDEINALHLNAHVLVHFGPACLSPSKALPVIYSFGATNNVLDISHCVETVTREIKAQQEQVKKLLILYQQSYHHSMNELADILCQQGEVEVVIGEIPRHDNFTSGQEKKNQDDKEKCTTKKLILGGLEIPSEKDLSCCHLLYITDSTTSRQFVHAMLPLASMAEEGPAGFWIYSPSRNEFQTQLPRAIRLKLNRRFFVTQKARETSVFGILVGTLSERKFTSVVAALEQRIREAGRACYTFALGNINLAKLANFAEIECYILVACRETSLLDNERDFHVPIITPHELDVALGNIEWGRYSLDYNDFLANTLREQEQQQLEDDKSNNADDDAPYFSLISGTFVDSKRHQTSVPVGLEKQQLTVYQNPVAAAFLKQREYQGIEASSGDREVHAALPGQLGIASHYSANHGEG